MAAAIELLDLSSFLIAIVAGILIGIPTGPARFFVVDTSLHKGKIPALKVYGGFLTAILAYAGLALIADGFISRNEEAESIAYFVASILLIFWGVFIIFNSDDKKKKSRSIDLNLNSLYMKGLVVGLSNPVIPFIYLALLQVLKAYSDETTFLQKAMFILTYEIFSFLTTWIIARMVAKKKELMIGNWNMVKIAMGFVLIGLGVYNAYQLLDFRDGISLREHKSMFEEEAEKAEE